MLCYYHVLKSFNFQLARRLVPCYQQQQSKRYHTENYDVAIVGGGIVGMATARELMIRYPKKKFILLEKEPELAIHQTGHNSGVIHAGMYYQPGTLRAKLCVEGLKMLYDYCDEHHVPYKRVGKLIVALKNDEVLSLQSLYDRGRENNVTGLSLMTKKDIKEVEPHCQGVAALHSANTGIIDYAVVTKSFAKNFQDAGGVIATNHKVDGFSYNDSAETDSMFPVNIQSNNNPSVSCKYVVTCGGLQSDRISKLTECKSTSKILPFRGDYFVLKPHKEYLVNGNIYPLPDPRFPFLGVHFTPRMDGSVWLGPTATLAFKREGYQLTDFNMKDTMDSLTYKGFRKFLSTHWKHAAQELYNTFNIRNTVKQLQKYVPDFEVADIERGPSGVRAQALGIEGNIIDDFIFDTSEGLLGRRCLHVCNAPSPAATSSLAIAKMVADRLEILMK